MSDDLVKRMRDAANRTHDMTPHGADCLQAAYRIEALTNCVAVLEAKLAQQDDLVQAAVAAALTEAAQAIQGDEMLSPVGAHRVSARILTLIPEDAQAALDRVVAAAETRGYQKGYAARSGMPTLSTRPVIYSGRE